VSTVQLLADAVVTGSGESKKSGPIGLAVILLLCVACYFLFKSMSRHLRRVREDFPAAGAGIRAAAAGPPAAPADRKASGVAPSVATPARAERPGQAAAGDEPPPARPSGS
jgi:hypothetical protein